MKEFIFRIAYVSLLLSGCVEVRDGNDQTGTDAVGPRMVEVRKMDDLVVGEELFLFEGRFLNRKDLETERNSQRGSQTSNKDYEFHFSELRFAEQGILYTMGNNVRIHVDNLIAEKKGLIATFPQGMQAKTMQNGRAGGHLFLNLGNAKGALKIEMRGENGGPGLPGEKPDASLRGPVGASGTGICDEHIYNSEGFGKKGGKGLKGYPGKAGGRGGNTGSLELLVKNSEGFSHQIEKIRGTGGAGGEGGLGGPGGAQGKFAPGCFKMAVGPMTGPEGDRGDIGPTGSNGEEQPACLTKGGVATCF